MLKPKLIFTKKKNSFVVKIANLEKLSVSQIQELESFVKKRNGIFDFDSYEFIINKNIEYEEFIKLINYANIEAMLEENIILEKQYPRIGFGQYKGMQYNELSDSYILWLKENYRGSDRDTIDKELKKRNL